MENLDYNKIKSILCHPREHFAAMDGAKNATTLLKLWDELAEQHPDLVEDTLFFYQKTSLDFLSVRFLEGGPGWIWVELKTEGEPVQCRYKLVEGVWLWDSGADEPEMSLDLRAKWENGPGDALLTRLQQTEKTQFLKA